MVDLAHKLGLEVVAEGVETEVELEQLRRADCDEAQGFLLGRPAPLSVLRENGVLATADLVDEHGPGSVHSQISR
jgi:EAL domain-containing protein (putative c-di-GMP-specific phosphodiesterase class I)